MHVGIVREDQRVTMSSAIEHPFKLQNFELSISFYIYFFFGGGGRGKENSVICHNNKKRMKTINRFVYIFSFS